MKILHLILLLLPLTASGQWEISAGYKYHIDHFGYAKEEADPYDKDDPYVQDMFLLNGRFMTKNHWQFGIGTSYLQNAQHFFYHDQSNYNDAGAGGSYSKVYVKEYAADVTYGSVGLSFSFARWFMHKRTFQIGVGIFQHNDFRTFFRDGAKTSRTYEDSHTTMNQNGTPVYSTTHKETPWTQDEFPTYAMREHFGYGGLEVLFRYNVKSFCVESSLSCAVTGQSRLNTHVYYGYYDIGKSRPPWFERSRFIMPGCSLRIGYRFPAKKAMK